MNSKADKKTKDEMNEVVRKTHQKNYEACLKQLNDAYQSLDMAAHMIAHDDERASIRQSILVVKDWLKPLKENKN